ncbi:hypothetical protein EJB05_06632, partial [Eragrostis curvula]
NGNGPARPPCVAERHRLVASWAADSTRCWQYLERALSSFKWRRCKRLKSSLANSRMEELYAAKC